MRVRVRKVVAADGWDKFIIETKKWYTPWIYKDMVMVTPNTSKEEALMAEQRALKAAESLKSPTIIEVTK